MNLDKISPQSLASYRAQIDRPPASGDAPESPPAAAPAATNSSADRVELRASARELRQARQKVDQSPDAREARVAALRAQVQSGTYQVDAEKLARRLLRLNLP